MADDAVACGRVHSVLGGGAAARRDRYGAALWWLVIMVKRVLYNIKCVVSTPKRPFSPRLAPKRRSQEVFLQGGGGEKENAFLSCSCGAQNVKGILSRCSRFCCTFWEHQYPRLSFRARPLALGEQREPSTRACHLSAAYVLSFACVRRVVRRVLSSYRHTVRQNTP